MKRWVGIFVAIVCIGSVALADEPPKNATVLFDGKDLSKWSSRTDGGEGDSIAERHQRRLRGQRDKIERDQQPQAAGGQEPRIGGKSGCRERRHQHLTISGFVGNGADRRRRQHFQPDRRG